MGGHLQTSSLLTFGTGAALGLSVGAVLWRRQQQKTDSTLDILLAKEEKTTECEFDPASKNKTPPRPVHVVLRPESDPRVDKAMYARYDPIPERKTGAIMIVVPGGNYDESDIFSTEAQPVAQWLAERGITSVVLQYRCVSQGHYWPAQFEDWDACARSVKMHAKSWGCDESRVGVIGFSAGGHLAAYAACRADEQVKPKLHILIYPAIDTLSPRESGEMDPWYAADGYPPIETSSFLLVDKSTPPAFLAGVPDDVYTPPKENTDVYAHELEQHGVQYEYVLGPHGYGHGCGLEDWWTTPCEAWLLQHGWISAPEP